MTAAEKKAARASERLLEKRAAKMAPALAHKYANYTCAYALMRRRTALPEPD